MPPPTSRTPPHKVATSSGVRERSGEPACEDGGMKGVQATPALSAPDRLRNDAFANLARGRRADSNVEGEHVASNRVPAPRWQLAGSVRRQQSGPAGATMRPQGQGTPELRPLPQEIRRPPPQPVIIPQENGRMPGEPPVQPGRAKEVGWGQKGFLLLAPRRRRQPNRRSRRRC